MLLGSGGFGLGVFPLLDYTDAIADIASGLSNATTGLPALVGVTVPILLAFTGVSLFYRFVKKAMHFK